MPLNFSVTREDMLRSNVVKPGWYVVTFKSVDTKAAKSDGSTNTNVEFVIAEGPYAGTPVKNTFSEKAPGFAVPLIEALLGRKMKPEGESVDFEAGLGKKIKIYIVNDKYQGRMTNKIEDYQAI